MNEILNINNVHGYLDKETGTAYLNAEDVARGLGFTQEKNGVEYVRWETVNGYLRGFGFSQHVGKDDFLPENMVYRLGSKASNEKEKRSMNEILNINNVHGYLDKETGTAYLNAEDVARGLGFTQEKNGVEYVRWETVNGYLRGFGFSQHVGKDDFLPENMVYRLGFKASNEVAQKFQAVLADEVLPAIRRHGAYMTDQALERAITEPDFLIRLATQLKEEQARRKQAELMLEEQKPAVIFAGSVSASKTSILIGELAKILRGNGIQIGQKRLFQWMRENGYLIKRQGTDYNMPTQRSKEMELFEIKEGSYTNGNGVNIITKTPKVTGKGQVYFTNKFLKE